MISKSYRKLQEAWRCLMVRPFLRLVAFVLGLARHIRNDLAIRRCSAGAAKSARPKPSATAFVGARLPLLRGRSRLHHSPRRRASEADIWQFATGDLAWSSYVRLRRSFRNAGMSICWPV